MLGKDKEKLLRRYLMPFKQYTMEYSRQYPIDYLQGDYRKLKNVVADFYKDIARKYKKGFEVIQTDLVDELNNAREADSFNYAFHLDARGDKVTVWIGQGYFELIVKVSFHEILPYEY